MKIGVQNRIRIIIAAVLLLGIALCTFVYLNGRSVQEVSTPLLRQQLPALQLISHLQLEVAAQEPVLYEYYATIDQRMRQVFPDKFEAPAPSQTKRPATVVAPTQRATSAKKVRLTQSQVAFARRANIPLEEYARHVALLEQSNA